MAPCVSSIWLSSILTSPPTNKTNVAHSSAGCGICTQACQPPWALRASGLLPQISEEALAAWPQGLGYPMGSHLSCCLRGLALSTVNGGFLEQTQPLTLRPIFRAAWPEVPHTGKAERPGKATSRGHNWERSEGRLLAKREQWGAE